MFFIMCIHIFLFDYDCTYNIWLLFNFYKNISKLLYLTILNGVNMIKLTITSDKIPLNINWSLFSLDVMIRQPKVLILDWCKITKDQLSWLLVRLPQSKALSLQGCSWPSVSCLRSCVCPMLTSLNLSFVPTMDDTSLQHILSPPLDHRPGLIDLACRLSNLKTLKLAGSNITEVGVRVIVRVLTKLSMLDLSQCFPITDEAVESLTQISSLSTLQLSGCTGISELSLKHLGKCKSLTYLDVRHTKLTKTSINKFVATREGFRVLDSKLIVLKKSWYRLDPPEHLDFGFWPHILYYPCGGGKCTYCIYYYVYCI